MVFLVGLSPLEVNYNGKDGPAPMGEKAPEIAGAGQSKGGAKRTAAAQA